MLPDKTARKSMLPHKTVSEIMLPDKTVYESMLLVKPVSKSVPRFRIRPQAKARKVFQTKTVCMVKRKLEPCLVLIDPGIANHNNLFRRAKVGAHNPGAASTVRHAFLAQCVWRLPLMA